MRRRRSRRDHGIADEVSQVALGPTTHPAAALQEHQRPAHLQRRVVGQAPLPLLHLRQ